MNRPRKVLGWRTPAEVFADHLYHADTTVLRRLVESGQYCSGDHQALLGEYGPVASMSRKGNCWDNAPMENFFNNLKNEQVFHEDYVLREEAKQGVFEYI